MFNKTLFALITLCLLATAALAGGHEFCSDNTYWMKEKRGYRELKESTIQARSLLEVDGRKNGGIKVKGTNRKDILIRSCIQAWARSESEAKELANKVSIETGNVIRARGENGEDDSWKNDRQNWSVSYEIEVPRNTNLKLTTLNGGIAISQVEGNVEFEAVNGGIVVYDAGGNVRGRTKNGGIAVVLSGKGWKGDGLDLETTNGGVNLSVSNDFAADIESSTVNGGFSSNLRGLTVEKGRWTGGRAYGKVNGGGAKVRVVTTNGGVSINSGKDHDDDDN